MNGRIITGTPIAVDFWQLRKCASSKLFFLSHAHSDHTQGLTSTWRMPIYCSELTGKIAVARCGVVKELIRPLTVGEAQIIPLDEERKETMTVTLIDANHCPGATMFLFEGYFGRFLYTGDFRYQPVMCKNYPLALQRPIDRLYLDNTYNHSSFEFPSEADCRLAIMQVIGDHPYVDVVIGMHQLGKEDLLEDIAAFLDEEIQVSPERMALLNLIGCKPVFTTEKRRVTVVQQHTISWSAVERWNDIFPTIVIIPSAVFGTHRKSILTDHPNVFIIPYSSHSSYSELEKFIRQVKPKKIIPIVNSSTSKKGEKCVNDVSNFDHYLNRSPAHTFSIPQCVQDTMNGKGFCDAPSLDVPVVRKRASLQGRRHVTAKCAKGVVFEDDEEDNVVNEPVGDSRNPTETVTPTEDSTNVQTLQQPNGTNSLSSPCEARDKSPAERHGPFKDSAQIRTRKEININAIAHRLSCRDKNIGVSLCQKRTKLRVNGCIDTSSKTEKAAASVVNDADRLGTSPPHKESVANQNLCAKERRVAGVSTWLRGDYRSKCYEAFKEFYKKTSAASADNDT
ncbi:5' exonuclease Apollo-like [Diadema antillarum]|uniref:5' exonuclease Apollo-like n=1 Tax=Diadema antillarum TaxID=105358 RepID=UPI003A8C824A